MDLPRNDASPWTDLTSQVVYDNPWITVNHRTVITPTGTDGIYGLVHFKNRAIGIVPVDDDDHTWLVGQYRYATEEWTWEIPEGGGDLDEDPAEAARRELAEECGLLAEHVELLCTTQLSNSVTDERGWLFVATGLTPTAPNPDDTEVLEVVRLPVDQAIEMVRTGEITDALSTIGLLTYAERRRGSS